MGLTSVEYSEVKRILKEQTEGVVIEATEAVAAEAAQLAGDKLVDVWYRQGRVSPKFSVRPIGNVTIMDVSGMAMQAKHGTLTKAAAAVGLEVKSK